MHSKGNITVLLWRGFIFEDLQLEL